jgi:hypothetical protein
VLVEGQTPTGTSAYTHVAISTTRTVTIIGPGQGVAAPAEIFDATNDLLSLSATSAGVTINATVDGLEIGDRTNNTLQNIVYCNTIAGGAATLTIRRSALQHTAGTNKYGLTATSCAVTMDSDVVENNGPGGLLFATSDFTVENSVIALNGGPASLFGGIQMSGTGTANRAQLINVTIADNSAKNQAGVYSGIDCGGTNPVVFNSVVASNANNQLNASCTLGYSAFAGATGTNHDITGCTDTTLFVNSGANPYKPLPTATVPCILVGKGAAAYMSVSAPAFDLLGAPRPASPSDGAYE